MIMSENPDSSSLPLSTDHSADCSVAQKQNHYHFGPRILQIGLHSLLFRSAQSGLCGVCCNPSCDETASRRGYHTMLHRL